jgi:hypothetical protein
MYAVERRAGERNGKAMLAGYEEPWGGAGRHEPLASPRKCRQEWGGV